MFTPAAFAALLHASVLAASPAATLDACTQDVLHDVAELRGRNAWAARCFPELAQPRRYPEASFVSVVGEHAPTTADAPCPQAPVQAVVCGGEGLLAGQPVRTPTGWLNVAELAARQTAAVSSWDSRVALGLDKLVDSPLLSVLARPYNGPVIYIETEEGAVLDCTAGQMLVRSNGTLVRADALCWGDLLLGDEGVHHVERIKQVHSNTVAYQVLLARGDFDHNVFDVGGLFVGALRLLGDAEVSAPPANGSTDAKAQGRP